VKRVDTSHRADERYLWALKALFWMVFVAVVFLTASQVWPLLRRLLDILTPFIIGLILAYVFHPIVRLVEVRFELGRLAGVIVVAAALFGVLLLLVVMLAPILYGQTRAALEALSQFVSAEGLDRLLARLVQDPERREELLGYLRDGLENLKRQLAANLAARPELVQPVAGGSAEAVRVAARAVFSVFGWLGGMAATTLLAVIIAFYCLLRMSSIPGLIRRAIPLDRRETIWGLLVRAEEAVGGFLRGQLIACAGVGLLASILLFAVGLHQYAVLIGFLAGAVNFIPYLGPTVGALPALLWALLTPGLEGWEARLLRVALLIGGFGLIQAIDGFVFQPLIVGRRATLHPLAVMLALIVGAQFGLGGMILAVPVACVVKVFIVELYWKRTEPDLAPAQTVEASPATSPDPPQEP